jgi:soluble lytic murein transglycosylase-like protein
LWALASLVPTGPALAQVIEVDAVGGVQTFDGPTVFTNEGAVAIVRNAGKRDNEAGLNAVMADAARTHGLDPRLLEAVAWQESRGRMSAVSSKGALGVMQLMPGTAAELGVRPTDLTDNVRGGALYLRRQLDRFGSISLALAAYNAGPGAVMRFGGVPPYRETRDYVANILARWRSAQPTPTAIVSGVYQR